MLTGGIFMPCQLMRIGWNGPGDGKQGVWDVQICRVLISMYSAVAHNIYSLLVLKGEIYLGRNMSFTTLIITNIKLHSISFLHYTYQHN